MALVPGKSAPTPVAVPEGVRTVNVCPPKLHDTVAPGRSSTLLNVRLSPILMTTRFAVGAARATVEPIIANAITGTAARVSLLIVTPFVAGSEPI
jgi:hypothetical protein